MSRRECERILLHVLPAYPLLFGLLYGRLIYLAHTCCMPRLPFNISARIRPRFSSPPEKGVKGERGGAETARGAWTL